MSETVPFAENPFAENHWQRNDDVGVVTDFDIAAARGDTGADASGWIASIMPDYLTNPVSAQAGGTTPLEEGTTPPGEVVPRKDPMSCETSPAYRDIIGTALMHSLHPEKVKDARELLHRYNCEIGSTEDAIRLSKEAFLTLGDPYAEVMNSAEADAFRKQREGSIQGIGVGISRKKDESGARPETGPVEVQSVFEGPAQVAGLQKGDLITHVNGQDISTWPLQKVVNEIRGPIGTSVKLTISRDGETLNPDVKRDKIQLKPVKEQQLDNNIAYINLTTFDRQDAASEMRKAITKHKDAHAFIIDLRDNGGGIRDHAVTIASLFMDKGTVMTTSERVESSPLDPKYRTTTFTLTSNNLAIITSDGNAATSARYPDLVNRPTVVLVNGGSASASEILAGALKDNQEAILIGTRTFGKGIGQAFFHGPAGSLIKVTTSKTFNPSGHWVGDGAQDLRGITPDIVVENPKGAEFLSPQDAQLQAAQRYLADKLKDMPPPPPAATNPWWVPRIWPFNQ